MWRRVRLNARQTHWTRTRKQVVNKFEICILKLDWIIVNIGTYHFMQHTEEKLNCIVYHLIKYNPD